MSGFETDPTDHDFARRAVEYWRREGLSDDQVQGALIAELGFPTPEAVKIISPRPPTT